jgi:hypothetical protein
MDESLAQQYLADALVEVLFRQPGPTRWRSVLEQLPAELQVSRKAAQEVVEADERLVTVGSRWDLAHRADDAIRPLGGALQGILQACGQPMPRARLIGEILLRREGDPVACGKLLSRLSQAGREVGEAEQLVYLSQWLVQIQARDEGGLLFLNELHDDEDYQARRPRLQAASLKGRTVADTAAAILKAARHPLPGKGLALLVWEFHRGKVSPEEIMIQLCRDERLITLSGPRWILASQLKGIQQTLASQLAPLEAEAQVDWGKVTGTSPVARFKLTEEIESTVRQLTREARTPVAVSELVGDLLELRPRQKNYGPAIYALESRLSSDLTLLRLAPGYYLSRENLPPWVHTVPEALRPEHVAVAPSETSLDVILPLEQMPAELVEVVRNPVYEDQGEAEVGLGDEAADETTLPVLYHHTLCGTLKLRLCDRRLFDVPGPLSVVEMQTPDGWRGPVWVNTETRLLYGLFSWFTDNLPPSGALLTIRRSEKAGLYELSYDGKNDLAVYVGRDRTAEVLGLRERLRRRRAFLTEVAGELLSTTERGLAFDQLWAQVNMIRRTTRLQLASVLHHHDRFTATENQRWRLA